MLNYVPSLWWQLSSVFDQHQNKHSNPSGEVYSIKRYVVSEKKIFLNFSQSEYITGSGSHVEFSISIKNSSFVFINYHMIKEKSEL